MSVDGVAREEPFTWVLTLSSHYIYLLGPVPERHSSSAALSFYLRHMACIGHHCPFVVWSLATWTAQQ